MRVKLNVGGVIYETTTETLTMKSEYFQSLFNGYFKNYFDEKGNQIEEIFIDRSGKKFEHILNYMRGSKENMKKYEEEFNYYLIITEKKIKDTNEIKKYEDIYNNEKELSPNDEIEYQKIIKKMRKEFLNSIKNYEIIHHLSTNWGNRSTAVLQNKARREIILELQEKGYEVKLNHRDDLIIKLF